MNPFGVPLLLTEAAQSAPEPSMHAKLGLKTFEPRARQRIGSTNGVELDAIALESPSLR